jgi:hypothetical protein
MNPRLVEATAARVVIAVATLELGLITTTIKIAAASRMKESIRIKNLFA